MKILIGSQAMSRYPYFKDRTTKDFDYFSDKKIPGADTYYHPKLEEYEFWKDSERVASIDELYTIKVSHIFWDLKNKSWDKHASDIMKFQDFGNAEIIGGLYKLLYSIWEERYGSKKANLSQMANNFFDDAVNRKYVHDSIHASIAYYDAPLYERILMDGEEVKVDRSKFDQLSYDDKLKLVREEVYATALERIIIPSDYKYNPRRAYNWALRRTVTSLARGWFALFIVENLRQVWRPDCDYVKRHLDNKDKLILLEDVK